MPTYIIDGKSVKTDVALTNDELEALLHLVLKAT